MQFTLIVRTNHLDNTHSALEFAKAVLEQQHNLNFIYFMLDGAYTANKNIDMPTDEPDLSQAWRQFAITHNVEICVCTASALRRGINQTNLATGFKLGSIGQLVAACDVADRVVSL